MPDAGLVSTDVTAALDRLRTGGVVAIPTETVYGLGADADDHDAVARVFEIKGRPAGHPVIVHLGAAAQLPDWARSVPPAARVLIEACWPGPLTVLVERSERVLDVITGGRPTVGLRVPAHPMTLDLLARFGGAIAAPSANRFGRVSPTTAAHVAHDLGDRLDPLRDLILDGGAAAVGVESTIVDCTVEPPQILRPGGIPTEHVVRLLESGAAAGSGPPRASGMLPSHYAPRCAIHLVDSRQAADRTAAALARDGRRVDVLDGSADLVEMARNLYADLRRADERALDVLVAVLPPASGLGHAIRDRLTKAAAAADRPDPSPGG